MRLKVFDADEGKVFEIEGPEGCRVGYHSHKPCVDAFIPGVGLIEGGGFLPDCLTVPWRGGHDRDPVCPSPPPA